jgi:hypothetical protein
LIILNLVIHDEIRSFIITIRLINILHQGAGMLSLIEICHAI